MKVYARFSIKPVGIDDCSAVDLTRYSYILKFCSAKGAQDVLQTDAINNFLSDGRSRLHACEFIDDLLEVPLVWCDIYCNTTITDKDIYVNSFPNDSLNNNWTVFNKKFSKGETTSSSSYDKICTISIRRMFIDPQFPIGDPLDPFEKNRIERQLKSRLQYLPSKPDYMRYGYPDQGDSSLCGPAVILYSLLIDCPDLYCQYIKDLWNNGKAKLGSLEITPSDGCRHPNNYTELNGLTRVPAIDWISMASLRDEENISSYTSPDEDFYGITLPSDIAKWAKGLGSEIIYENMGLIGVAKYSIIEISNYVSSEHHVAVLINDGLLKGRDGSGPTHWIMWEEPITVVSSGVCVDENTVDSEFVDLKLFSWGEVKKLSAFRNNKICSFKELQKYTYGAVVFKKIKR